MVPFVVILFFEPLLSFSESTQQDQPVRKVVRQKLVSLTCSQFHNLVLVGVFDLAMSMWLEIGV